MKHIALAATLSLWPLAATAQDWSYSLSPYVWGAGLSGDTKQFGLPAVHLDLGFGDVIENLDFAVMLAAEARRGGISFWGDLIYTDLSADARTSHGIVVDRVKGGARSFVGTIGAGYSVVNDDRSTLDLVGGLRIWDVKSTLDFHGGILDGRSGRESAGWVDAMVGARFKHRLSGETYLSGWALAGGGGADVDWDIAAMIGHDLNERVSVNLGYRVLGVGYDDGSFAWDVIRAAQTG
ncbi:DUF481 domain-containing protein [Paracoccus sp. (in: a-proteobacteria)]|uniref:DUF481 domain-containing protein n=1 Tax=Paracoccus sp. TaxID=267 RepID=UPI0028A7F392|nr:DUF481 domain-containing protein [Paracoccus sp. (in: a-proteobacteria)]